jgi:hypothetical protein
MAYVPGTAALPSAVGAMDVGEFGAADASKQPLKNSAIKADEVLVEVLGRFTDPGTGRVISARLNPEKAAESAFQQTVTTLNGVQRIIGDRLDAAANSGLVLGLPAGAAGGARRRQRGGDRGNLAILVTSAIVAGAAYLMGGDVVAGAGAAGVGVAVLANLVGESNIGKIRKATGTYLDKVGASKVADSFGKVGATSISLADSGVQLAFAVLRLPLAGATAVVGTAGKLLKTAAEATQSLSDVLEKEETHIKQADLIVKNGTLAFAAALSALTASGALPLMTIFSVMLWTGKLYASPLGRAVGIIELYLWWINQKEDARDQITAETKKLVGELSTKGAKVALKTGSKIKEAVDLVGEKIKEKASDVGAEFEAGFAAGIQDPDNPLIAALSLGFCRATGLMVDPTNAVKVQAGESGQQLGNLADDIIKNAFPKDALGTTKVDLDKLKEAIAALKAIKEAAAKVESVRAELGPAKEELAKALSDAGIKAKASVAGPGAAGDGAAGAPAPGAAAAAPAAVKRKQVTGADAPAVAPAAPAGDAASGTGPAPPKKYKPAKDKKAAVAGEPEGGRRRKTRRKRMVRRITKKVKDFYY